MERISNESSSFLRYGGRVLSKFHLFHENVNHGANEVKICCNDYVSVDQRVINWPLMETPLPLMCIVAAYLMVIYRWGPA